MNNKDKKRVDQDIRPKLWFSNYDYAGPEEATEISPGKGLYNGKMDKYKSVKDFIEQKRKRRRELKNAKFTSDQLLKAATRFSQLVAQMSSSGDATTLSQTLKDTGVWGGDPFDPNNPVAKKLFAILDKYNFQGKLSTTITVDDKLNVKINTVGADANVANAINATFAPMMSAALKKAHATPPTETMTFGWLEDVG